MKKLALTLAITGLVGLSVTQAKAGVNTAVDTNVRVFDIQARQIEICKYTCNNGLKGFVITKDKKKAIATVDRDTRDCNTKTIICQTLK